MFLRLQYKILSALMAITNLIYKSVIFIKEKVESSLEKCFDKCFDIETSERDLYINEEFNRTNANIIHSNYIPSNINEFVRLFRIIGFSKDDVFVDYGAGKGRTLFLAAELGIQKVIGIEISEELCKIANSNIDRYKRITNSNSIIEINKIDAARYVIDNDSTIFYFFSPFSLIVYGRVINNIELSFRKHPRKLKIIIFHPEGGISGLLEKRDWLKKTHTIFNKNLVCSRCYFFEVYESHY